MNKILIIFDTDCDSSLIHPLTKERLISDGGTYYLLTNNKEEFLNHFINKNSFEISEKVYSSVLHYLQFDESKELLNLESSSHYFGNYSITIVHNFNEL